MLSLFVIPVFVAPSSQFLCSSATIMHGCMLVHFTIFSCGFGSYKFIKPTEILGAVQWYTMFSALVILFVLSLLASLHTGSSIPLVQVYSAYSHVLPLFGVNTAVLAMSSLFALAFVCVPTQILSTFWEDDQTLPNEAQPVVLCGFKQLQKNGVANWFARITGLAFLSVNVSTILNPIDGVENGLYHPLYSIMALSVMSLITLFNFNVVIMGQYEGISVFLLKVSWIPNLVLGCIFITLLVLALVVE